MFVQPVNERRSKSAKLVVSKGVICCHYFLMNNSQFAEDVTAFHGDSEVAGSRVIRLECWHWMFLQARNSNQAAVEEWMAWLLRKRPLWDHFNLQNQVVLLPKPKQATSATWNWNVNFTRVRGLQKLTMPTFIITNYSWLFGETCAQWATRVILCFTVTFLKNMNGVKRCCWLELAC